MRIESRRSIVIDPAVRMRFPGVRVAAREVTDVQLAADQLPGAALAALWQGARETLAAAELRHDTIGAHPAIAVWRRAYETCGLKPSAWRSSIEALVRRVLKHGSLVTPLPLVDAYCAIAVRHLAPLGAWDLDRLPDAPITLRHARPDTDRFTPLGGKAEEMPLTPAVVVYAAGDELLCWSFNHRDSALSGLAAPSNRALFIGEALDDEGLVRLRLALDELGRLLAGFGCGVGTVFEA